MAANSGNFLDGTFSRVLLAPLRAGFALTLGLVGLLLLSWAVHWLFLAHVSPMRNEGLRLLLAEELLAASALEGGQDGEAVRAPANCLYALIFQRSGMHETGLRFREEASMSIPDTIMRSAWIARQEQIEAAMLSTQLLGLRMGVLLNFLPLLVLLYAVGTAEGFSQRTIRRAQVARESASLYHRAKYGLIVTLALGGTALLVWPAPVAWGPCVAASAVLVGILTAGQWMYYKKHV